MFQTLHSIKHEVFLVLEEEEVASVSVNIFEWKIRDMDTLMFYMNYDVEINLFDHDGVRIDNWVTDIMPDKWKAVRRSKHVIKSVHRWFDYREQEIAKDVMVYSDRMLLDRPNRRKVRKLENKLSKMG